MASGAGGIGRALRAAREAAGLSQREAADLAKVHKVSVSRWEGGRSIGSEDLAKLAGAYRLTVSELLAGGHRSDSSTATQAPAPDAREPAASVTGGLGVVKPRSMDFWEGRQSALLDMMQFAADLQRQAAEWQGRSIEAQRELMASTRPAPLTAQELADQTAGDLAVLDADRRAGPGQVAAAGAGTPGRRRATGSQEG